MKMYPIRHARQIWLNDTEASIVGVSSTLLRLLSQRCHPGETVGRMAMSNRIGGPGVMAYLAHCLCSRRAQGWNGLLGEGTTN